MKLGRELMLAAALLVMVKGVACFAEDKRIETLSSGASAPDFNLPGVDGKMHRLGDYADAKVLVVIFTCNHCPAAQAYEGRITKLVADYRGKGVAVVAISPNDPLAIRLDELGYTDLSDSLAEMKIRAAEKGFNFPYLYDGRTQKVSMAYGPVTTPHVFVFDKERKLRYEGGIDNSQDPRLVKRHFLRNAIDALLAGRQAAVKQTKTFGCSIKWSSKREWVAKAFEEWAAEPVVLNEIDASGLKNILSNDTKKLRLVNLWASWCGPCVIEFPELVRTNRMYRGRDFEMVTVSTDMVSMAERALGFLKEREASMQNCIFAGSRQGFIEAFDVQWRGAIPYTLVIKPGGEIIYRHEGMVNPLELRRVIVGQLGRYFF